MEQNLKKAQLEIENLEQQLVEKTEELECVNDMYNEQSQ